MEDTFWIEFRGRFGEVEDTHHWEPLASMCSPLWGAIYSRGERWRRTHNRGQKDAQQILERSTHAPTKFHIGYAQCTLKDQKWVFSSLFLIFIFHCFYFYWLCLWSSLRNFLTINCRCLLLLMILLSYDNLYFL